MQHVLGCSIVPFMFHVLMLMLCVHNCYADDHAWKPSDVCSFTGVDTNLCNGTLTSPECAQAKCNSTTKALCMFLVSQAKNATKVVKTLVLAGSKKNGNISKEVVDACLVSIADAIGELKICYDSVKAIKTQRAVTANDVHNIWYHANAAGVQLEACGNELESVEAEDEKEALIEAKSEAKKFIYMIKASVVMFLSKTQQCTFK